MKNVELCLMPNRCIIAISVCEPVFDVLRKNMFSSVVQVRAASSASVVVDDVLVELSLGLLVSSA